MAFIFASSKNGKYIGMATESILYEHPNSSIELGTIDLPFEKASCGYMEHLFMVLKEMTKINCQFFQF